ncbi:hypothetical protein COX21_02530 [Candidatus Falkowbacteria bacterium CG23_combo_of_CG06-09_8_20_14_all_41_10]|uniref:NIF system FeS cluster assembly NifU C-terminal domain-containing protein n=1 Tax=Candidatus Falkowbacteria bacterium CG23_combo_of_CG06-09_8_20_14_all_41_10 TaxID=1974571 RepID=A0A2G9ZMV5_9BACT|nr:MAG: hypothetical protein COX21_02530 [Candidatus Falkowbacteria bacterium CG23_combo_of_CG06-09_8_20_14_all_41_10]
MTKAEVEKMLVQIKPMLVPPSGSLELVSLDGNEIKLKVTGLPQDIFKVQGKIVKTEDEIKRKIAGRIEANFAGAKVSFV